MRLFCHVVVLVVFILATSVTVAQGPPPHSHGVQKLMDDTGGKAKVRVDKKSGEAKFVRLPANSLPSSMITNKAAKAEERAKAFFGKYGNAFGVDKADSNLKAVKTIRDGHGGEHAILRQSYEDIPVFGGEVRAHFDSSGELFAVNGTFVSHPKLDTTPRLSPELAGKVAIARVQRGSGPTTRQPNSSALSEPKFDDNSGLTAVSNVLMVFRAGLLRGTPGRDHLVYEVEVVNDTITIREFVYVDAHSGEVVDQITGIHEALDREVSETGLANVIWDESNGDPLPPLPSGWAGGTAQQVFDWDNEIYGAGETYNLIASMTAGVYDSYDGAGATMRTVNNDPGIACPNANWNGTSTNYCSGVTGDDTVAHEWGHAYTEYTNNLIYQWQSGALSESYSDIWGEVVDFLNGRGFDTPGGLRTDGSCSDYGSGGPGDDSVRWLSGEDDPAFGGAIRDMWNPTCYGDPGKVTDANYFCSTLDSGGVHFNSGIPNHAFALMVDGGTYNGVTVGAIGLTKAAHIHWAAQNLLTQSGNFVDHADALEAACSTLTGVDLPELSTSVPNAGSSGKTITAADCAEVADAIAAVELRTLPTQCNFQPLLDPDAPQLCEGLGSLQTIFLEDFEGGSLPAGWTASSHDVVNAATFDNPGWSVIDSLPIGASGSFAAFGPDPVLGDCGADTEAGVVALDSPPIALPNGEVPHVAFDHWVATEAGWDGGNLKVSVNGGAWTLVPGSAYAFNPYNGAINGGANDNPLADEQAFTGADGGSAGGSWGQSQVDLFGLALPGDSVQLRFDLGTDGCNGVVGWYVDDVRVYSCSDEELPVCGDGIVGFTEQCDDGNGNDGDGCSNMCEVEMGFVCEVSGGASNVIADGSFEAGPFGGTWNEFSSNFGTPICDAATCGTGSGTGPSDGSFWTWFGGIGAYEVGVVNQSVTIPATATNMTFDLEQAVCDSADDYAALLVDGNLVWFTVGSGASCGTVGYSPQDVNVSAYADGGVHELQFQSEIFATNGSGSNFFIDNVVLSDNAVGSAASECTRIVEDLSCNAGAVEYTEGIPLSWTVVDNAGTGVVWTDITTAFTGIGSGAAPGGNFTGGSGDAASVSSDANFFTEFDTELQSNSFSLANAESASLGYLVNYQNLFSLDFLDLDVSTDGGSTWANLSSWNEDHPPGGLFTVPGEAASLDLAAYLGEPDVQVRWHYYDPNFGDWDWYAQVDNIALACDQTGQMSGGGSVFDDEGTGYTHGFELNCLDGVGPNELQINWGKGQNSKRFHLTELTEALCSDSPGIDDGGSAGFDTFVGAGTGTLNKEPASITFRFTDAGEPGTADEMEFAISGPDGAAVSGVLMQGNHQAEQD